MQWKIGFLWMALLCRAAYCEDMDKIISWVDGQARPIAGVHPDRELSDMRKAFDDIVGEARIVALGESGHALRDIAIFRIRFWEYLVKVKGSRAIALESGFFEGQLAERYVQGLEEDIGDVLRRGFTHNMGCWEETRELLEWMKKYNARQGDIRDKIHFYGMDLPLFQDSIMNRTPEVDSPLEQVLSFVEKVEVEEERQSAGRLAELARLSNEIVDDVADEFARKTGVRYIDPDYLDELCSVSYGKLSPEQRQELSFRLNRLIDAMEIRRVRYLAKKNVGEEEYQIALQLAKMSRDILGNLEMRKRAGVFPMIVPIRSFLGNLYGPDKLAELELDEIEFRDTAEEWQRYFEARNGRERIMAKNVEWLVARHKKVLIYAHNGHVAKAEFTPKDPRQDVRFGSSLGEYLAARYAKDYVVIAQTMDRFVDAKSRTVQEMHGSPITATESCSDCLEKILKQGRHDLYVLSLDDKSLEGDIRQWLDKPVHARYVYDFLAVNHLRAFDAILFMRDMQFGIPIR